MAKPTMTPKERGTLLLLMAEGGRAVPNPELKDRHGVELPKASREKLKNAGLVAVGEMKRPGTGHRVLTLQITEAGWTWAATELTSERPRTPMGLGPFYAVLAGLGRYLQRQRLSLPDVFGAPLHADSSITTANVEADLLAAYRTLATRPREWIRLADVRDKMPALPREHFDQALWDLYRKQTINLNPDDNSKAVSERDHAAAYRLGNTDVHLMLVR